MATTRIPSTVPDFLARDPAWEGEKDRLWAMTPAGRVDAMRTGKLSLRLCLHWASRRPAEVPLLNGEWEFIAARTVDVADGDEHSTQRARVVESLMRRADVHETSHCGSLR